jgi:hypothetical protein
MSAPTTNPNAAIFFRILVMIGSFSCISSSVKPKQPHLQASAGVFELAAEIETCMAKGKAL